MKEPDLYRFISQCRLGVQSSVASSGAPQSALVGIAVTEDLEIIFDTVKTSRKYSNLIARPACSFVFGWTGEQTVQYDGVAEELGGRQLQRCQEIYFQAWPDGPPRSAWPGIV
jgi:pyridoxine/pyridoxamine 5'-phosphate oxidase